MSEPLFNSDAGRFATSRKGALDEYERDFILQKSLANVPVSAIAKMIGRPVEEVRPYAFQSSREGYVKPPEPAPVRARGLGSMPRSARQIVTEVAERRGLTAELLLSDHRHNKIAHARQEAFALLYATERYSLPMIGAWFARDHTTVLHGVRAHERREAAPASPDPQVEERRAKWREAKARSGQWRLWKERPANDA